MKKILLGFLVFQFYTFAADAQIQKGSIMLGGSMNYTHNSTDSESKIYDPSVITTNNIQSNQFTFNPHIGYTLDHNLVIGTYLRFHTYKATSDRIQTSDGATTG